VAEHSTVQHPSPPTPRWPQGSAEDCPRGSSGVGGRCSAGLRHAQAAQRTRGWGCRRRRAGYHCPGAASLAAGGHGHRQPAPGPRLSTGTTAALARASAHGQPGNRRLLSPEEACAQVFPSEMGSAGLTFHLGFARGSKGIAARPRLHGVKPPGRAALGTSRLPAAPGGREPPGAFLSVTQRKISPAGGCRFISPGSPGVAPPAPSVALPWQQEGKDKDTMGEEEKPTRSRAPPGHGEKPLASCCWAGRAPHPLPHVSGLAPAHPPAGFGAFSTPTPGTGRGSPIAPTRVEASKASAAPALWNRRLSFPPGSAT